MRYINLPLFCFGRSLENGPDNNISWELAAVPSLCSLFFLPSLSLHSAKNLTSQKTEREKKSHIITDARWNISSVTHICSLIRDFIWKYYVPSLLTLDGDFIQQILTEFHISAGNYLLRMRKRKYLSSYSGSLEIFREMGTSTMTILQGNHYH